eukprot:TRINITY_DN4367_c0_g1_i1.p1 TRINITY_DN4367_c0_g1~~TRINITY_DN4367_c0_g1_i1.p1  ORF type:complete len:675 (-),score=220.52 TRINITY_DN4367_c0_g1_i1:51-2075(-)
MENINENQEGGEQSSFLSDSSFHFEEFFAFNMLNSDGNLKIDDPSKFHSIDTSEYYSDSFDQQKEEISSEEIIQPSKQKNLQKGRSSKMQEDEITFDPETGTLYCKLGTFQHLQFILPSHPMIIETKKSDKWSRLNESVRKFFTKKKENISYISLSPKREHSEIYKLIKETKFLKQRNSYLLVSLDKKDEIEKYLDSRFKNKRKSKRKLEDEDNSTQIKKSEPSKKKKIEVFPKKNPPISQKIDPKFQNLFIDLEAPTSKKVSSVIRIQNQPIAKISIEGEHNLLNKVAPFVSPSSSSFDLKPEQRKDLPHYFLDSSRVDLVKNKDYGDFKNPFDSEKLKKHGLQGNIKDGWIGFVENFVKLPKLCKSSSFEFTDDLSQFSLSLIQFSEQYISSKKKSFDSINLKNSSSFVQVLRVSKDLFQMLEKLHLLRSQIKQSVDGFESYDKISKLISEEYIFRTDVSNKIKQSFDYLIKQDNLSKGNFFLEEYLLNFSVCGSSLLVKDDRIEILGNFDVHEEAIISPSRFFQDVLDKTSLEIGQFFRFFLNSKTSSLFVSLKYYSSNLDLSSQLYLYDIEFSFDQNLLPLSFILSPLQSNHFLYISHHYHKGNIVDLLHSKFPFHFDRSSFPLLNPLINRVQFLPQQNLTRIDYSLILESERLITSSSSSFKQILNTIL